MNKTLLTIFVVAFLAISNSLPAQIFLKLNAVPGTTNTWGVSVTTCSNLVPSANTITGSGQITIVYPAGMTLSNLTSISGAWLQNALVTAPSEAPNKAYASFGFLVDNPQIVYQPNSETLLFTFKMNGSASGTPALIVNTTDPFDHLPNSANSNPGNELTVLDFGVNPMGLYSYVSNYADVVPACGTTPQDTTVIVQPGDSTIIDTTVIVQPGDSTIIDTTVIVQPGDSTVIDTTVIVQPGDSTQQTSNVQGHQKQEAVFILFPTPTYDWITVKFISQELQGGKIRLFTLNGTSLGILEKGQNSELKINVGGLSSGLYYLSYELDGKTLQRERFLKQ